MVLIAALGFAGGFFIVPIFRAAEHRPDREKKARCWPRQTCCRLSAFFWRRARITAGASRASDPRPDFSFGGVLTLAGRGLRLFLFARRPAAVRPWLLTRTIYRIRVDAATNIPAKGGALFVLQPRSFVDALLLLAFHGPAGAVHDCTRRIRIAPCQTVRGASSRNSYSSEQPPAR